VSTIVRPHITYDKLCAMPSDGNRYELFDGQVYMSPSPTARHQRISRRIQAAIERALAGGEVFNAPLDVVLAADSVTQPDLLLVTAERSAIVQDVVRGAPDVVVEVLSPSTAGRDREMKMELYARFGVGEYWIVDDAEATVEVYRLAPGERAYRLAARHRGDERVVSALLPDLDLRPAQVFAG
jgi:Uma2 family endonuclease